MPANAGCGSPTAAHRARRPGSGKLTGFFRRAADARGGFAGSGGGERTVSGFEREQMFALILLVIALFVAGAFRRRRAGAANCG